MNRPTIIGRAAPQLVHACRIQNNSNGDVFVRVLYEPVKDHDDGSHERRVEFQLLKGRRIEISEEEFDMGSFVIRQAIDCIEITRPNGQIQQIQAPFENVMGVELDWLFIIDDRNIQSLKPSGP